jgi:translation initiation factor IF-1
MFRLAARGLPACGARLHASSALCSRSLLHARVASPLALAPPIVGAVRLKKKDSHAKHRRATKVTVHGELDEELGEFAGKVTTIHGKLFEVALNDGRVIKAKLAGKLIRMLRLRLGDSVRVQYDIEMDEDDQTPFITGRLEDTG